MKFSYFGFQIGTLVGQKSELADVARLVAVRIVISQFGCMEKQMGELCIRHGSDVAKKKHWMARRAARAGRPSARARARARPMRPSQTAKHVPRHDGLYFRCRYFLSCLDPFLLSLVWPTSSFSKDVMPFGNSRKRREDQWMSAKAFVAVM